MHFRSMSDAVPMLCRRASAGGDGGSMPPAPPPSLPRCEHDETPAGEPAGVGVDQPS